MKNRMVYLTVFFLGAYSPHLKAQTSAGELIENTASVDYEVGGINQDDISSNTADFLVDRKVNFTLVKDDSSYVITVPGQSAAVLTYTLTNTSNDSLDFNLNPAQQSTGATDAFGGLDSVDLSSVSVFSDVDSSGSYESANDTKSYVDELAAGSSVKIFVVMDLPSSAVDADIAGVNLEATAAVGGTSNTEGSALVADSDGDDKDTVETLFADAAGTGGDSAEDGKVHALNATKIESANLTVVKSSAVINDPIRGTTNPLRIPGATVRWTITITNSGSAAASNIVVTDSIDTDTAFVAGSIQVDSTNEDDDASGADESDPNGADYNVTNSDAVTATISTLSGSNTSKTVVFDVTIN